MLAHAALAERAGFHIDTLPGACEPPLGGTFTRGSNNCKVGLEFCAEEVVPVCAQLRRRACRRTPGDCSCLEADGCFNCMGVPRQLTATRGQD